MGSIFEIVFVVSLFLLWSGLIIELVVVVRLLL